MNSLLTKLWLLFSMLALVCSFSFSAQADSRSIRTWVHCDGKTDDEAGVTTAFAAAKGGAFTLVVDCPIFIHVGTDIRRPIYIDDGTTVQFTAAGLFKVDNIQIPAFVLVNSTKVRLLGWRVQFVGELPIAQHIGSYYDNNSPVQGTHTDPSSAFTDRAVTEWVTAHRGIHFIHTRAPWPGSTDTSAVFLLMGNTNDVEFRDFKMFVAPDAKGSQFMPMAFASILGGKNNVTLAHQGPGSPDSSGQFSVPNHIVFSNIDLDGYYMGWQGSYQDTLFEHIRAHRYGDLQDDQGGEVGGAGKWFAPPHLFYLNYFPNVPEVENRNIRILDVIDYGNRVGTARDRAGDVASGFANSLKIGAVDSEVNGYKSYRPDGLLDLLTSTNLKILNVDATYDSSFLNNLYPAIRFPDTPYQNVLLQNFTLADKAAVSIKVPISVTSHASNLQMLNMKVTLNKWAKAVSDPGPKAYAALCPSVTGGPNDKVDVQFTVGGFVQKCN
jgi:hypothetical protein